MSDLRERLATVFGSPPKTGVTGVTPVTNVQVTPTKSQSYAGYSGYASDSTDVLGDAKPAVTVAEADADRFEERAAIAEHDGGLSRPHAELLAALETAPFAPDYDRHAIIDTVAIHLDRLAVGGHIRG